MNRLAILALSATVLIAGSAVAALGVGISYVGDKGSICVLIDGDGDLVGASNASFTSISSDVKRLTCSADRVSNPSGKTVIYDADSNPFSAPGMIIPCFDGSGGITTSWREMIKASGEAVMQCDFKTK